MMVTEDETVKKKKKKVKRIDPYACKHGKTKYKFPITYDEVCRNRYQESIRTYNKQFLFELQSLESMQTTAVEQLRFHRLFAITTLWPPLHTKKEIDFTINKMYKLSDEHNRRLNEIMSRKYS